MTVFEGTGFHNQLYHFVNTTNPGPTQILPEVFSYSVSISVFFATVNATFEPNTEVSPQICIDIQHFGLHMQGSDT